MTGRGIPDISFGSGIWNCAKAGVTKGKRKSETGIKTATKRASNLLPHDLQNLASSSLIVAARGTRTRGATVSRALPVLAHLPARQRLGLFTLGRNLSCATLTVGLDIVGLDFSRAVILRCRPCPAGAPARALSGLDILLLVLSNSCKSRTARERRRSGHLREIGIRDLAHRVIEFAAP